MRKRSEASHNPTMTREAREALRDAGFSRRKFLQGAGALVVSFSSRDLWAKSPAQVDSTAGRDTYGGRIANYAAPTAGRDQLDSWIAIASDGSVTAYTGKEEFGQGIETTQTQLVAEELCVPFERVKLIFCDTSMTPDQGATSGSQTHPSNFNHKNLAQAGATARQALLLMASKRLNVPVEQLVARDGAISAKGDAAKTVSYGELVGGKKFAIQIDPKARRKPHSEWTVLGKPIPRTDLPSVVTAEFEFVQTMRLPGMLHGRVVRPPAVGATVVRVDESSIAGMPGVVKVVVKKNFVGVVAQKPWQAMQAVQKLAVTWTPGTGLPKHADLYEFVRNNKPTRDTLLVDSGNVEKALAGAATVVKSTYHYPYQMHGSMAPSCAVADVQGEKATLYSPTQSVWGQKHTCAMVLGLKPENVRVIFRRGSACYGLNGADSVTYDAALMSQAVGKPVKLQYSRKDEMAWGDTYGFAYVMDERAGLDAQGNIVAWEHESWAPVKGYRPRTDRPGNVVAGMLAGFETEPFMPRAPAPDPTDYDNATNNGPAYFSGNVGGKPQGGGIVKAERSVFHNNPSPFFTGPLRCPWRLQNTFAHESFVDELAAHAKTDPLAFRLQHLKDPRLIAVAKAAAKLGNWEARPSPKAQIPRTGVVSGHGIAAWAYEGDNGWAGMVVEIEVDQDTGKVTVKRMAISNDCGPISNPDGLRNQLQGEALQGLSRALWEEVTWDDQKVTSVDWNSYRTLHLGFDIPKIEITLIDRPNELATGAGETVVALPHPAVGNAIFDATGVRIRQVPFTPERVKAALKQRS